MQDAQPSLDLVHTERHESGPGRRPKDSTEYALCSL